MSFGKECPFPSPSGAASRVFFQRSLEGDPAADGGVGGAHRSHVALSYLGFTWFARKIDLRSPHVPSLIVSSCCPLRSSSPSQGKSCLSRTYTRLSCAWGWTPSESREDGGRNSQEDESVPFLLSISSLDILLRVVIKSLKSPGAGELDLTTEIKPHISSYGRKIMWFV